MSDFLTAYKTVRSNEGGYRNVSYDKGGETYKGVARNSWPAWKGWEIVDAYKKTNTIKHGAYIKSAELDRLVIEFFRKNFWDKNSLGLIANQSTATLALDMVINHGRGPREINKAVAAFDKSIAVKAIVTPDTIAVINRLPEQTYTAIAKQRVAYVQSLSLGPDQVPVLNRAKAFLSKFKPDSPGAAGATGALVAALLFFSLNGTAPELQQQIIHLKISNHVL